MDVCDDFCWFEWFDDVVECFCFEFCDVIFEIVGGC